MPTCPKCHQPIKSEAITCPSCRHPLKAYGHPGMTLYQAEAEGETFLCDRCVYHKDDTCTFPQRPYAKTCTLFQDETQPLVPDSSAAYTKNLKGMIAVKYWIQRHRGLVILGVIIAIALLLALLRE